MSGGTYQDHVGLPQTYEAYCTDSGKISAWQAYEIVVYKHHGPKPNGAFIPMLPGLYSFDSSVGVIVNGVSVGSLARSIAAVVTTPVSEQYILSDQQVLISVQ